MSVLLNLFDVIRNKDAIVKVASNALGKTPHTDDKAKEEFLRNFKKESWGVSLIIGKSGSGKTALCVRLSEFLNRPTYALNMLKTPEWIDSITRIRIHEDENGNYQGTTFIYPDGTELPAEKHCTVIVDDANNILESNRAFSDVNETLKKLSFIARHLDIAFLCNSQNTSGLSKQVTAQARVLWFKEPGLLQDVMDRDIISRIITETVKPFFESIPKTIRNKYTYVYSDDFCGILMIGLAKGWNRSISENKG